MKIAGIIAEYNPFHNGHAYQIAETRHSCGAEGIVCVMSGNFVQRGGPAIFDKWQRAYFALLGGADLVIELPCRYAVSCAEQFAWGAVATLDALGCVDVLSFGAESGNLAALSDAAACLEQENTAFQASLARALAAGKRFVLARAQAASEAYGIPDTLLSEANNILAIEYMKALRRLQSMMQPYCVRRKGPAYHSTVVEGSLASATGIRTILAEGGSAEPYVPKAVYHAISIAESGGFGPVYSRDFDMAVLSCLRRMDTASLARVSDMAEGLQYRIKRAAQQADSIDMLIRQCTTKRYSEARIRRLIWSAFLSIGQIDAHTAPTYIRVLGMNTVGSRILKVARQTARLPIVTKAAAFAKKKDILFETDVLATDLYSLALKNESARRGGRDFTTSPILV